MTTVEKIIEKGYKEFKPTRFHSEGIISCFQKRFRDNTGTKFFIDINQWEKFKNPKTGEEFGPDFEYEVQLYSKESHNAVNLLFHTQWDIDEVEKHVEDMFNTGAYDYYEVD